MDERLLKDWVKLARSLTDEDRERHTPPQSVWDNIDAALEDDRGGLVPPPVPELGPDETPNNGLGRTIVRPNDEVVPPEGVIDLHAERNERAPATVRKSRRRLVLAGAAALFAIVVGASLLSGGDDEPELLFAADVTNDGGNVEYDGAAVATIVASEMPVLEIDFDSSLPSDEIIELWLVQTDPDTGEPIDAQSLGTVRNDSSMWSGDWPTGLDPAEHSLVVLSIEPDDGDPAPSGQFFLLGELSDDV